MSGAAREHASLVFWARQWFKPWAKARWQWQYLRRILRSEYFWQDNVLTHWNRLLGCQMFGHRHVMPILDYHNDCRYQDFCFNCYRPVGEPRDAEVVP